ncbi:hypothetical protein [Pararhodobacter oceanensis]|uniref:hypothetical protein n=1 Tax=Pararhodobacter oceanensis TaxID=2172121 RepID=UPI003A8E0CAD
MTLLRTLSFTLVLLAFAISSVTMAVARNQPRAVGEMILCTAAGAVSVAIDANGQPTGPQMPCPECTQAMVALTGTAPEIARVSGALVPLGFAPRVVTAPITQTSVHSLSRGPPVLV